MSICEVRESFCVSHNLLFRSEEHTSELQSQSNLVCRLLLEKKKILKNYLQLHTAPMVLNLLPAFFPSVLFLTPEDVVQHLELLHLDLLKCNHSTLLSSDDVDSVTESVSNRARHWQRPTDSRTRREARRGLYRSRASNA